MEPFPWYSAVGNWLFSSHVASVGKNKTLKRLSGLIEDSSFKRLVAYENALWRAPGATENVFSVDQEMFGRTVTDQIRDAMIKTITAKHLIIYISMFVQYTYLYPYTSFLLLLTSISISQGGKSLFLIGSLDSRRFPRHSHFSSCLLISV